jgi:hypothetical protein
VAELLSTWLLEVAESLSSAKGQSVCSQTPSKATDDLVTPPEVRKEVVESSPKAPTTSNFVVFSCFLSSSSSSFFFTFFFF